MTENKWYKVISKDCKAKDGGDFDYSEYITNGSWTPEIKNKKICNTGYHVTKYWNMFLTDSTNRIFEVEVKDLLEEEVLAGVCEKAVCSSLRIVKEFIPCYKNDCNTGYSNTGDSNTGDSNTGDSNTGYSNTGNSNTGDRNTGYSNTGNSNTGDRNTGNWNTGSFHAGAFNTKKAEHVYLFDKLINKKQYDEIKFPNYFYFNLGKDYKQSWKNSFAKATQKEKEATIKLPNFDFKVFQKITGITKQQLEEKKELEGVNRK
jgi:hypothetical protein